MTRITTEGGEDITESVQILYDIAHSSIDWGSGFLDNEEVETIVGLAVLMGWQVPDLPDNSEPMAAVAQKFPDHYDIEWVSWPAAHTRAGYQFEERRVPKIRAKRAEVTR